MATLRREHVMIAREMQARRVRPTDATQMGVDESTLRYRLGRPPVRRDFKMEDTIEKTHALYRSLADS